MDVVIAHHKALEQVILRGVVRKLLVSVGKEGHFQRKCEPTLVFIEFWQKRVVGKTFQNQFRIKIVPDHIGQSGFPGTYISFQGNKMQLGKKCRSSWI